MNNPLKFGVVGCGRISEKHLGAIAAGCLDARLVAVTDIDRSRARAKAEKYNVPWYADYHEMLRQHPEIEVVSVLTPTGYHARHVIDLARYGRHIVVEKPMALTVADAQAMIAACEQAKGRLFVVKQNRFNRAVVAARAALDQGRFGKPVLGAVRVRWRRDQAYYDQADWRGTWALDGGVMSQQASRHIDLLQWFMGPVVSVQCVAATRLMKIEVEDTAAAIFKFNSGALGGFEATVAARPKDIEGSLSILGENGSVVIGGIAVNTITHWQFGEQRPEDENMIKSFSQEVPNVYGYGHIPYLASVIESIRGNRPAAVDGGEGRKNVEILAALYESAARGGEAVAPGSPVIHSKLGQAGGS